MITELAELIMQTKTKAESADTFEEYNALLTEYRELRKRWEAVAGQSVIGIEIKAARP